MKMRLAILFGMVLAAGTAFGQYAEDQFDPNADGSVYAIAVQTDGKIVLGGTFGTIGGVARTLVGRVLSDGRLDTTFAPGVVGPGDVNALAIQSDGKVVIGGEFQQASGQERYNIARLNTDGSLDVSFNPVANDAVNALAIQSDGKILVGGEFVSLGGQVRNFIGRVNADGSLDTAFNPTTDGPVNAIAVQSDGKILVGGFFALIAGTNRRCVARLNSDGSIDSTFAQTNGADDAVCCLAIQADRKIIIGGEFSTAAGEAHTAIARLNADGSPDAAFNPVGQDNTIYTLAVQPNGKIFAGGEFSILGGVAQVRIGRLNIDGTPDTSFAPVGGALDTVRAAAIQADGKIVAGGLFHKIGGENLNHVGRLYPDGRVDMHFIPQPNSSVYGLALQADGNILVGGPFDTLLGGASDRHYIARIRNDATVDTFNPIAGSTVYSLSQQPDGEIIVAGNFITLAADNRNRIARLNADATLDAFNPDAGGTVNGAQLQADGKIFVNGAFLKLGNVDHLKLGRVNADGTVDAAFTAGISEGLNTMFASAIQADGKILVGGAFNKLNGVERKSLGRLNTDGSLDTNFNPVVEGWVIAMAVQPDGKIVVGGVFTKLGGTACTSIGRLNADGSYDTSFNSSADVVVYSLALQADGKIIVGGTFHNLAGVPRLHIGRLNANGTLDTTFDLLNGSDDDVNSLAIQPDGKILVGGIYHNIGNEARTHFARISNTEAALQTLSVNAAGTAVTWLRSGTSPEVWRTTFEQSADGSTWTNMGAGTWITNGWQLTGLALPQNQAVYIRARGYGVGGIYNGSGSIYESIRVAYLTTPTVDITNISGTVTAAVDAVAGTLSGTANTNVVGTMQWINSLGATGTFAAAAAWSVTNVPLAEGTNTLTVSGSNIFGVVASDSANVVVQWSKPEAADFDGDGQADPAAVIGTNLYAWLSTFSYSRLGPLPYGVEGAVPVAADFDGDRVADPAAYLGINWYAWLSTTDYAACGPYAYGIDGAAAIAADFDGDGLADPAVYVGTDLYAWLSRSGYAQVGPYAYGIAGATHLAADFDGDRFADPAAYIDGNWYAWLSNIGYAQVGPYAYGFVGAAPMAADFDGDGLADPAVSYNRQWYAWLSSVGYAQYGPYAFNLQ